MTQMAPTGDGAAPPPSRPPGVGAATPVGPANWWPGARPHPFTIGAGTGHPGTVDIALIVVTYNSGPHVTPLLASLDAAMGAVRARFVFVDNSSDDDTVPRLRRWADPRAEVIVQPDNRGYAAAINAGVRRTGDAPAVLVLNPDLTLAPGCIPAMLAAAGAPDVGIVVPRFHTPGGALYHSLRREPTVARAVGAALLGGRLTARFPRLSETVADDAAYAQACDVDWATGAAMLVTRACADATGPWDESFFLYSEETDFAHRARSAGFRVRYEPAAVVTHTGGDCMMSPRLRTILARSRVRYFRRRHGRVPSAAFHAAVLANETSRGLLGNRAALAAARGLLTSRTGPPVQAGAGTAPPG